MEYEVQSARITTTGKLPDRFLNCQTKTSTDLTKVYMGTIYSLVEIVSPWFSTAQVGQTIINTFSQNYYLGGSTSDLANFEEALKKVNEALAYATQNGETNWIGNLNAILAVVIENKIHLAQTGRAEAYIFREGKINHLTYGLGQNQVETHPLKTFSNITSGELKSKDKVLITSPDLVSAIDLETLREIIALHHPNEAILQIAKILKRKKIKTVNCIILDLLSLEEASRQPVNNLPDNLHLDKPIESVWAVFEKIWNQVLKPVANFTGTHVKKASDSSLKFTKNYIEKVKAQKVEEPVRPKDRFDNEFLEESQPAADEGLLKDEEIQYSPELNVHHYERQLEEKHDRWRPVLNILNKAWIGVILFAGWLWKMLRQKRTRPYFLIVLAVIILVILGLVISARRQGGREKINLLEAQNILREAEAARDDAKSAALASDQDKARDLYAECVQKTQKISSIEVVKGSARELEASCLEELDKLTSTTRFKELSAIVTAEKDTKAIFVISGQVFFATKDALYQSSVSGVAPIKVATLPRNNGDFQFGTVVGTSIYLYTSAQKVYEFKLESKKLELVKIDGNWETANAIAYYAGNIYLLDGILGQIYRHTSGQNAYEAGVAYISSASIDVKNSTSIAVDGSIYVLRSSGEVLELQKGKLMDFSLRDVPSPNSEIAKPVKIYTDPDTTSIYILDAAQSRILEFDKDGRFVHQYAMPANFTTLTDFTVSVKAKKIWVLNENSLYEIEI